MNISSSSVPKWLRITIPSVLIVIWLTVAAIGGPYFGKISEVTSNDQASFLPESAESTKVTQEIKKFQEESIIPALVVFTANDSKELSSDAVTAINTAGEKLSQLDDATGGVSPAIIADDNKAAFIVVNAKSDVDYKEFIPKLKDTLKEQDLSVSYSVTGPLGFLEDLGKAFAGIDGLLLGVALAVVFVILLFVYRSPILPFLVLLNSVFALCAAILVVFALAKADIIALNGQVQGILFILVVGAATDYALLFVARYREELTRHKQTYQAIVTSWKRSLEPIVAAGGTVIAGLLCLLLSDLSSNKALGPVGAIGIVFAIVSALTLLPSLLLAFGRKAFWPRIPQYLAAKTVAKHSSTFWSKVADFVHRHTRKIWVITTAALLISSLGLLQLNADGVPQSEFVLGTSEARDGQAIINKHFPGGSGTPAQIISDERHLTAVLTALENDPGVASVSARATNSSSGLKPLGKAEQRIKDTIRAEAAKTLTQQKADLKTQLEAQMAGAPSPAIEAAYANAVSNIPSVDSIVDNAYPFKNAQIKTVDGEIVLEATLQYDADSTEALQTIERLRTKVKAVDASARIGGISATQLDTQVSSRHDRAVVIPVVLVVITIILMLLLRSILAPLLLLATTVLSFAATLGIAALLFNHVWNFPGADPSVVLYGFIFLVALGIDYNIFLMTRVREESLRIGTRKGVLLGLVVTGGVITSAGIVLAATFAALAVIPILFLAQLAFIVAFGVLLDATVIRSLLVPALVHDIGSRVWWPSKRHKN